MTRAAVHTTIRELSHQISRRERKARELEGTSKYDRPGVIDDVTKQWRKVTDIEWKQRRKDAAALRVEAQPLRDALSALSDAIGKGLL